MATVAAAITVVVVVVVEVVKRLALQQHLERSDRLPHPQITVVVAAAVVGLETVTTAPLRSTSTGTLPNPPTAPHTAADPLPQKERADPAHARRRGHARQLTVVAVAVICRALMTR